MGKFNIEIYLYSLPENTTRIDIRCRGICELPDITRFTNLQYLDCDDNNLMYLPTLPESLIYLSCHCNKIRSLPSMLPENLQYLYCSYNPLRCLPTNLPVNLRELYCMSNQLSSLPALPANLEHLYCSDNKLTSLPELPENLQRFHCQHNRLNSMPMLPESITSFGYYFNPIWDIQKRIIKSREGWDRYDVFITIKQINIYNSFRYLYYSLKFKRQFKNWLWEKVRKPKIEKTYNPKYLIENLDEDSDLDMALDHWIHNGDCILKVI